MKDVYLYALGSNLFFALGSQVFAHYSRHISSVWMNTFKAVVAIICFALTIIVLGGFQQIDLSFVLLFFISGAIGLGIGDIFLLKSFSEMGPGRTLILFSFQPIIIGFLSYLLLGQDLNAKRFVAIIFFILCIITFATESFRKDRHWQIKGISIALLGMTLDAIGVVITRYTFNQNPQITSLEGNFYRCIGAIIIFGMISYFRPIKFISRFKTLSSKSKVMVILGSIMGTYLSLALYLKAIQTAHLASLSAMAINATVFSAFFECIIDRKWPSRFLILAFIFFFIGMGVLVFY